MTYPTTFHDSLAKVEASREGRLGQTFPRLSPQERQDILRAFLETPFEGGRHVRRVEKVMALEKRRGDGH